MTKSIADSEITGSFRDPSGSLFRENGSIYRLVNESYRAEYEALMSSGLHEHLVASGALIPCEEVERPDIEGAFKVLKPEFVEFVSYPYEWCFGQLKDAALLTLEIQKKALDFGMTLKDASAFNVQFHRGRPVFIDTLSFKRYHPGEPWVAYRQFCRHFLAPLALMSETDIRLGQLSRIHIDGVPLDLASALLPKMSRLKPGLSIHIHAHSRGERYFASRGASKSTRAIAPSGLRALIESLESTIKRLSWHPTGTEWAGYYEDNNYGPDALEHKMEIVGGMLGKVRPRLLWDLGANSGLFSRIASDRGALTISFDSDPAAVELNYRDCLARGERGILPLIVDLTNPSPSIGWAENERMSLVERGPADAVLALALVHHLAISNNLPLTRIARFLRAVCEALVIEFVPKSDSQVQRLLATREDVFPDYTREAFEASMTNYFEIEESVGIQGSERRLYLMRGNDTK